MNKAITAIIVMGILIASFVPILRSEKNIGNQNKDLVLGSRADYTVNDTMTWDDIQAVFDSTIDDDTVLFEAGDYNFSGEYNWTINNSITIEGEGESTWIWIFDEDGDSYNREAFAVIDSTVTFRNFSTGSGIVASSSNLIISNLSFEMVADHNSLNAIYMDGDLVINDTTMNWNVSDNLIRAANIEMNRCDLYNTPNGSGIALEYNLSLQNSTIEAPEAVVSSGFTYFIIANCTLGSADSTYALYPWANFHGDQTFMLKDNILTADYCVQVIDRAARCDIVSISNNTFNGEVAFLADEDDVTYSLDFATMPGNTYNVTWILYNLNTQSSVIYNLHEGSVISEDADFRAIECYGTYFEQEGTGTTSLRSILTVNAMGHNIQIWESYTGNYYPTRDYGYMHYGNQEYATVVEGSWTNFTMTWYFEVPDVWDSNTCKLYSGSLNTNLTLFRAPGNVSYTGIPQRFVLYDGTTGTIELSTELIGDLTILTDLQPAHSYNCPNGIILRSHSFTHNYTTFTLEISKMIGDIVLEYDVNFEIWWSIYSWNGNTWRLDDESISWNYSDLEDVDDSTFSFGDVMWIYPESNNQLPSFAPQGNYTIEVDATADGEALSETVYAEVGYYGDAILTSTGGFSDSVWLYGTPATNATSVNEVLAINVGNTIITSINITCNEWVGEDLSTLYMNDSLYVNGHQFNATTGQYNLTTSIPASGADSAFAMSFDLKDISDIPLQNYSMNLDVEFHDGENSWTDNVAVYLSLGTSRVLVSIQYADYTGVKGSAYALELPMVIEGETNVLSHKFFVTNHGRDAITELNFSFSSLYNVWGMGSSLINISDNAQVVDENGFTYDVGTDGSVVIATSLAPGEEISFQLRILEMEFDYGNGSNESGHLYGFDCDAYSTTANDSAVNYLFGYSTIMIPIDSPIEYSRGSAIEFASPLSTDKEATNHATITQPSADPIPAREMKFIQDPDSTVLFYVQIVGLGTYHPDEFGVINVELDENFMMGQEVDTIRFYVESFTEDYNESQEYNFTMELDVGISYTVGYPAIMRIINFSIHVAPIVANISLIAGMNFVTLPEFSGYNNARDIVESTGALWIAMWDGSGFVYYFDDGTGSNFPIVYGTGYILRKGSGDVINLTADGDGNASYNVPAGLSLIGNPTNHSVYANNLVLNSTGIDWVAQWTGTNYRYFFVDDPTGPGSVNFEIVEYECIWAHSPVEDIVEY